jgi:hypothetical protein
MKERISVHPPASTATSATGNDPADAAPTRFTLRELTRQHKAVAVDEIVARFPDSSLDAVVADGQRVTTERLVRGATAILGAGLAILEKLTPSQRELVLGLDAGFFSAAISATNICAQKGSVRDNAVTSADNVAVSARSQRNGLAVRVKTRRTVVYNTALSLAGTDPTFKVRLDEAWGSGDTHAHYAASLHAITMVTRDLLKHLKAKKISTQVTTAWLDRQAALAEEATAAIERADVGAVPGGTVAQGEVAWWRGVVVWFLRTMANTLNGARMEDVRIPALPLGNLRSIVYHARAKKRISNETKSAKDSE